MVAGAADGSFNDEFDVHLSICAQNVEKRRIPTSPKRKLTERGINEEENDGGK